MPAAKCELVPPAGRIKGPVRAGLGWAQRLTENLCPNRLGPQKGLHDLLTNWAILPSGTRAPRGLG